MHQIAIPAEILERNLARRGRVHALESIDPRRTALVVIDMQRAWIEPGLCADLEVPTARDIIANINRLASTLRAAGGTVAFTQHAWGDWPEFYGMFTSGGFEERVRAATRPGTPGHELWPDLDQDPADIRVVKNRPSAFIQGASDLDARLRERGTDTIVITGTLTNACCEASARDAAALRYKVVFVGDATATRTDLEHNAGLVNVMQFVADLWLTDELAAMIERCGNAGGARPAG